MRRNILARAILKLLVCFAIIGPAAFSLWWKDFPVPTPTQAQEEGVARRQLELNQSVSKDISQGQSDEYNLTLQANYYLRLTVAASGIGLRASLFDPEGATLAQTACRYDSPSRVSWIAEHPGSYRLKIEACETEQVAGNYQARIEERRPATNRDRNRVAASQAASEAEKLLSELNIQANREGMKKYEEALQLWRLTEDYAAQAETLRNIGEILQERGDRSSALRYFSQALTISRQGRDTLEESRIFNDIGFLRAMMGDYKKAVEACSRALDLSRANNDLKNSAQALSNLGTTYHESGELSKALEYQQQSLDLARELKDRWRQAQALMKIGYINVASGEIQQALPAYQLALSLFLAVKDYHGQALVLTALGHLYSETGSKQESLNYYNQATLLSQQMEDFPLKAELSAGMGYVYYELGEPEKALQYDEETLSLYRSMQDHWGEAATHLALGRVYHSMGAEQQALNEYRLGAVIIHSLSNPHLELYLLEQTGEVYEQLGQKQKALDYYQRALSLAHSRGNPRGQVTVHNNLGHLYESMERPMEALDQFNQALTLSRAIKDRFAESFALFSVAHVQRGLNNLKESKEQIEAALHVVESLRTNVASQDLRASYLASIHQYYELYVAVCMQMHKQQPEAGLDALAFEVSERARARSLLEMLKESRSDIRRGVDPQLLERERSLQQELNAKAELQMRLLSAKPDEAKAAEVAQQIKRLTTEYDEVQAQIRATSPRYAALTQPQPLSLLEIQQQALEDNTLLLEYALGDERSYLWAISPTAITSYELPPRKEIEDAASRFYQLLTANQPLPEETFLQRQTRIKEASEHLPTQAALLSRILLEPASKQLAEHRLLIVTDGFLQRIPFQALPVPENSSELDHASSEETAQTVKLKPLIFEHEIINQPSASALVILRKESEQRPTAPYEVAVIADPVFEADDPRLLRAGSGEAIAASTQSKHQEELQVALRDVGVEAGDRGLPRLLASREEAQAIMQIIPKGQGFEALDFEANREAIINPHLAQYRIVHLATHGLLNSKHPELSGLVLSLVDRHGNSQNGFLRLHDIYNLNLPVELVVLSACNTGLGKDLRGEGMIGLTRGFMYAGSASVMSSLWKVEDDATAELMKRFYGYVIKDGLSPAAALRAAQMSMSREQLWSQPYYWAAFTLQGEYHPHRPGVPAASPISYIPVTALLSLTLLLFGIYTMKKRRNPKL